MGYMLPPPTCCTMLGPIECKSRILQVHHATCPTGKAGDRYVHGTSKQAAHALQINCRFNAVPSFIVCTLSCNLSCSARPVPSAAYGTTSALQNIWLRCTSRAGLEHAKVVT